MQLIEQTSVFVDDVGMLFSASDVNLFRQNAIALDGLSYRQEACVDAMAANAGPWYDAHPAGDFLLGRWGIRWQTGMTTLTLSGTAIGWGSTTLKVYLDSVLGATITLASSWSQTISISAGHADGDIILIDIITNGNTAKTSKIVVMDIYATPITFAGWPGVPSFSGTYTAAKLNQLNDACVWLYNRLNLIPMLPTIAHFWRNQRNDVGDSGGGAGIITQYTGAVGNFNTNDILRVGGTATILTNLTEELRVYLAGSLVYTSPTWTPGTYNFWLPFSLAGVTSGTRAEVRIQSHTLSVLNNLGQDSRYSLTVLRSEASGAGYPVQAPPALLTSDTSYSATTINTTLNAICTMLAATYTKVTTSVNLTRCGAVRRIYGFNQHDWSKLMRSHPHVFYRRGDKLIVRGKNVSIGWGNQVMEPDEAGISTYKYKFANEQSVTSSTAIETQIIYLDTLAGLFPGMAYYILGDDTHYAAEFLG